MIKSESVNIRIESVKVNLWIIYSERYSAINCDERENVFLMNSRNVYNGFLKRLKVWINNNLIGMLGNSFEGENYGHMASEFEKS